ncbi:DNA circularization N-terminal domain-containing protein [Rhizobium sp. CBN3]|uniref:DNA circularization N-terminal domain-containing protein n=1 Tax=Rhizobium sp. CBN3 TaxID=3058045 RepID=UPI00267409C1|nr:DNA circularization N-terminal domain-containing protein [Rhizobium sp. CBN3]MDO3434327.1 DNA circularization N-terminal domain-containing protein [Rhizobium sp. CBN3]
MRNWQKTLRPASFSGVSFFVDYDELTAGKRLAFHEVAGGRQTVVEELGLSTSVYDVTLYLLGDASDAQALALQAVMLAPGPGFLMLPMDGAMMATAQGFRRTRAKDRFGYVAFDATFIPAVNDGGAVLSLGDVTATVAAGIAAAASQFARFF